MDIVERFWSSVDIKSGDECWLWTKSQSGRGFATGNGYGQFGISRNKNIGAHRFSAMLKYGMFHRRLHVMHTCDNPPCVNPAHLRLGTNQDNMRDMVSKGRRRNSSGEESANAKLTDAQVREIRARRVKGQHGNVNSLAEEFGVSQAYIRTLTAPKPQRRIGA